MKLKHLIPTVILLALPASASTVIWMENFESYDLNLDNLEDQGNPADPNRDWLTEPENTPAFAVIGTTGLGLPSTFGNKVLAVGGVDPGPGAEDAYALSPSVVFHTPTVEDPSIRLTLDMAFLTETGLNSITDTFRLALFDGNLLDFGRLNFVPSSSQAGFVEIWRFNGISAFNTGAMVSTGSAFTLELLVNTDINKWSAALSPVGGSTFPLFANVDINADSGTLEDVDGNFGGFGFDWIPLNESWGGNTLLVDNLKVVATIPEPGTAMLSVLLGALALVRRRR